MYRMIVQGSRHAAPDASNKDVRHEGSNRFLAQVLLHPVIGTAVCCSIPHSAQRHGRNLLHISIDRGSRKPPQNRDLRPMVAEGR